MARSLVSPKITLKMTGVLQNALVDGTIARISQLSLNYSKSLTSGVNANQANRAWQRENVTLLSGGIAMLDLYDMSGTDIGAGVGKDAVGLAVAPYEEIVAIAFVNENAVDTGGVLTIEAGGVNGWTSLGTHIGSAGLRGQGCFFKSQPSEVGFLVTAANCMVKLTAVGGDVIYSVYVLARHDVEESSSSSVSSSSHSTSSSSHSTSSSSSSHSASSSSSLVSSASNTSSSSSLSTSSSSHSTSSSSKSTSSSSHSTSSSSGTSSASSSSMTSSTSSSSGTSSASSTSTSSVLDIEGVVSVGEFAPTPDCTGNYIGIADYLGQPAYERQDGAYHVWYEPIGGFWYITPEAPGDPFTDNWNRVVGPEGQYQGAETYLGNPVFTLT